MTSGQIASDREPMAAPATPDDEPAPANTSPAMATALFADNDPFVLQALRHDTAPWCDVWDIHYADGPEAALALIDQLPRVDVLVTDIDMPGMTATDLLTAVRNRSPHTARIITSSRADRASVLHAIAAAHRYLSKPVDIDVLGGVIEHVRGASHHELRDPVSTLVGQVDRLPSPPELYHRLATMMASNDWTIDAIALELTQDMALTGEILKLVNSGYYGVYGDVTSVNRAISLVGIDMIRHVVLGNKLFQPDDELGIWLDLGPLGRRSKAVAFAARALAIRDGASAETSASAYLTGMVSEIGLLVLARVPDISPSIAQPLNTGTYIGAERAIFGGDRFEVGCQLLRLWGFSETIIEAIGQLSHPDGLRPAGLGWYLRAARRLVNDGFDPHDLTSSDGENAELEEALDRLRAEIPTLTPG